VTVGDALDGLSHDHEDLNRQVLELGAAIKRAELPADARARFETLREQLFQHFATEEEGLFPFVVDQFPDLADSIRAMETAHDTICGALARLCHVVATGAGNLQPLYDRFAVTYAAHAKVEAELLSGLRGRVDPDQRLALATLVRDL
jgi:hypothetical protein